MHSWATAAAASVPKSSQPSKLKTITNLSSAGALCGIGPQRNQWAEGLEWLLVHCFCSVNARSIDALLICFVRCYVFL